MRPLIVGVMGCFALSVFALCLFAGGGWTTSMEEIDLSAHFKDFRASTFVLYHIQKNHYHIHNPAAAKLRRSPRSTFKIPNSLIALESGVIQGKDHLIQWDGKERWNRHWNRDHTLESAFQHSTVWYYQELARRVGTETMQSYLNQMDYGNRDISDGIDRFWLGDSLKISAMEQTAFLTKLVKNKLPFSQQTLLTVKDIMVVHNQDPQDAYKDTYVLRGKTGSGWVEDETSWGWYVGYIELKNDLHNDVYVFAANIEARQGATGPVLREIVISILHKMVLHKMK